MSARARPDSEPKVQLGTNAAGPTGERALAVLQETGSVDLLLTDIVMPGMSGRELANAIQKLRPDLPILYMTGYSRNAILHKGRLEGGVEFLQKPVLQSELAARVHALLDRNK